MSSRAIQSSQNLSRVLKPLIYPDWGKEPVPQRYEESIGFLLKRHPGLEHAIINLIGSAPLNDDEAMGQRGVRLRLYFAIYQVSDMLPLSSAPDQLWLSYAEEDDADFNEILLRTYMLESVRSYFTGGVYDESDEADILNSAGGLRAMIYGDDRSNHPSRESDADYWRGFAILLGIVSESRGTIVFESERSQKEAHRFIEWAGTQKDIGNIIATSITRKIINVDDLQEILSQMLVTPSLGDGAL